MLRDLIEGQKDVSIALYAGEETVRIRLAVKASSQEVADALMKDVKMEIEHRMAEYIIQEKDLKAAVLKKQPKISLTYHGDFRFYDEWLKPLMHESANIHIMVDTRQESLGEVVCVSINDDYFEIPTFVKAEYSYAKVEARFVAKLYQYIVRHNQ